MGFLLTLLRVFQFRKMTIVRVASVCTLINFYWIYYNLQLFEITAVYVLMINKTISDIMYFFLMFFIVICAFGNAIMIIDRYNRNYAELNNTDYETIVSDAFGNQITDSLINQYLVGLGDFSYSDYAQNPSKPYLWTYFTLATFLTQIVFFNMLITVMGTTYEEVIENKERSTLISKTKILAQFVYACKLDHSRL